MSLPCRRSGFSLVELSVVLIIIGLLVGGILLGRDLYRSAQIKHLAIEFDHFRASIMAFQQRYEQLPGDMTNATDYWGAASSDPTACKTTEGEGTETCDGNGDGLVGTAAQPATFYERFRFWQQLSSAGLVQGEYTGIAGGSGSTPTEEPVIGVNVPQSAIDGVGFSIYPLGNYPGDSLHFESKYGNSLFVGSKVANSTAGGEALTPEEAENIDVKLDDGKPGYGFVMSHPSTNALLADCTLGATREAAVYNVNFSDVACSLILKTGL